ncbi:hypothetical protein H6F86_16630 [Phormidium sp. FACHB-592]|uniref:Transposase n=1 Tax=Stenomitos frigidus AS-A4 TaxID=2933935 RepID=A0ABV0KPB5_9CYAN|nr:hypothetical protein [Phormidium sp. FACHB-592]MBD2075491.1 hypothetical protein [Phormidium sp. FACHB-592]
MLLFLERSSFRGNDVRAWGGGALDKQTLGTEAHTWLMLRRYLQPTYNS